MRKHLDRVDVSDIFNFFLLGGGEGGAPETPRRGEDDFLLKIPGGGGGVSRVGGWGAEGRGGCLQGIRGRGAKHFFFGAERPTK